MLTVGLNREFPSIGLAVEAACPGDNVAVFEGRYCEAITLTKPIEIVGVGVTADIIVECSEPRPTLWAWAQFAKVGRALPPEHPAARTTPLAKHFAHITLVPCRVHPRGGL